MISMLGGKSLIVLVLASSLSVVGYQEWRSTKLQKSIITLEKSNAFLKTSLRSQNDVVRDIRSNLRHIVKSSQDLQNRINSLEIRRDEIRAELNSYKGRLHDAALKKTNIIERRINNAIRNLMREFSTVTGNSEYAD